MFCGLTLISSQAIADDEVDLSVSDMSAEKIQTKTQHPFFFESKFDAIQKTEIKEGFFEKDRVQFAQGEAQAGMFFYGCPVYQEGAYVAVKYTTAYIGWANNPWFEQNHFNTVSFSLGGVTHRLEKWLWKAQIDINMDAREWDINDYANYDGLLWGRYDYCDNIGIHIGLIVQTGMQMDRVYPILGADWLISKHWKLNLVFPLNVSLEYILNKHWSFLLAGRNFDSRFRVSHDKGHGKPLVRYGNIGGEFVIRYENGTMSANIHGGSTFGGILRVANHANHHPHRFKLKPSPYVGAEVAVRF